MRKLLIAGIVTVLGVGLWFWINNKVNWKQRFLRMEYLKSGRSEQAKQVILDFWSKNDSAHVSDADYLLEKSSIWPMRTTCKPNRNWQGEKLLRQSHY